MSRAVHENGQPKKLTHHVSFEAVLKLKPFMHPLSPEQCNAAQQCRQP